MKNNKKYAKVTILINKRLSIDHFLRHDLRLASGQLHSIKKTINPLQYLKGKSIHECP